jgi:iron complex transport system substrate-binding protein
VDDALAHLGCTAEVLTIDPYTLDAVFASIETLGKATGHEEEAADLVRYQRRQLAALWGWSVSRRKPRVMFLEWTDPPFAPGHWIPEMIELAGGVPLLATSGEKSRRVTWEDVHAAEPEHIVVAPCGYDRDGSQALADQLVASGVLPAGVPVHAVDANASWARPGTRLVDGVEELARLLHAVRPA